MRKEIYIGFIVLTSLLSSCDYVSEIRYKKAIIEGNQLSDSSRYSKSINEYRKAITYNDTAYQAYFNSGNSFASLNLDDSASFEFSKALLCSNDSLINSDIYYQLGNINLQKHQWLENQVNYNLSYMDSIQGNKEASITERIRTNIAVDSLLKNNDSILKNQETILQTAKQDYINSLGFNYKNDSAQYNYIFTLHQLKKDEESKNDDKKDEEKKEPTKFALKKKEDALKLIKQNEFKTAYNLLNNALQQRRKRDY